MSRNSSFGPTFAATARAKISSPLDSTHARRGAVDGHDLLHLGAGANVDAAPPRRRGHRLRDRTHAADGVPPGAALAVHLAEAVVQQHVGRARRGRRRVVADDSVEGEGALDDVALEPAVEEVGGAAREQVEQRALLIDIEARQAPPEHAALDQLGDAAAGVGRRLQHEVAQHVGGALEHGVVGREPFGIARRELGDRGLPLGQATAHQEIARVVHRPEVRRRTLDDLEAVLGQLEIGDDLRIEQAHRVGGDRVAKAGVEFLGHRRAADDVVLLQHDDLQARPLPDRRRRSDRCAPPR